MRHRACQVSGVCNANALIIRQKIQISTETGSSKPDFTANTLDRFSFENSRRLCIPDQITFNLSQIEADPRQVSRWLCGVSSFIR
jgi:hypothetical protein